MEKQSNSGTFWKIIATIGGVGGLVAICALIVAVAQLWQAVNSQGQQNVAQATEVAFDQAHLDELIKIVTLQARLVEGQPDSTATAIAAQINELQSTIMASSAVSSPSSTPRPATPMQTNSDGAEISVQNNPPSQETSPTDCSKLIEGEHHRPTLGTPWEFKISNEDRIIHIWSNHWDPNLPEYKFFLPAGQAVSFISGGGSYWADRPGCTGVAKVLFQRDVFRDITIEEYQRYIDQRTIP